MAQKIKRRSFIKTTSAFALGIGATNLAYSSFAGKPELVLVKDGKTVIPIVVPDNMPEETRRAVNDLSEYIRKISGVKPEIISGAGTVPKHALWVGNQPHLSKIFRGLDLTWKYPEEILIACNGKHVLVTGSERTVDGQQVEYGTANAVYTFLEKHLDVRWLWPGDLGEDIIRKDTITLPAFVHRFHPQFRDRKILQHAALWGVSDDWTRYQRLKFSSLEFGPRGGSHAFNDWWDKYHADHPDWFALQPDGTRDAYPSPLTAKLCLSNPEVWDQWLAEVEEAIKSNPKATIFNAMEGDSYSSGLCVCKNCRAWDHPGGAPWTFTWKNKTEDYVASTNRIVTFWNNLARKLKEKFPERNDLYVLGLAYGSAKPAPVDITIEKNIIISYVGSFPTTGDKLRTKEKAEILAWSKFAPNMYYRPNLWYWTGGLWGLPDMALKNVREDFRFLADNHFIGIRIDTAREHWCTQAPQYYLMAQMTWDPFKDGQAVLEDYYSRGFGTAAEKIKAYWNLMELARERFTESSDYERGSANRFKFLKIFLRVYVKDIFDQAYDLIRQAEEITVGGPDIYRKRVDFVKTGLDFTRLMIENISLMDLVRESKGKDREAIKKVSENWKVIKGLYDKAGPASLIYKDLMECMHPTQPRYMSPMEDYFGPPSEKFINASGEGYTPKTIIGPKDID